MKRWMRLTGTACVAVAMTCMVAGFVSAQDQQGGRRGGGRGFGGGFGRGFQQNIFSVVTNEDVQKDLALTEDQVAKVKTVTDSYNEAVRAAVPEGGFGGGPDSDVSQEDRQKRLTDFQAATAKILEESKPKLAEAISADQMKRLDEIVLQSKGANALAEEAVAKSLDLSEEQKTKVADATKAYAAKQQEIFAGGFGGSPEEGRERMEKMQAAGKERDEAIMGALTQEQKDKLASMKGKEFDVTKLRRFGGGRGQGGGRGPGGGREGGSSRPQRPAADGDSSSGSSN
jgi:hypothetical protein